MDNSPGIRSTKFSKAFRAAFDGLMSGVNTAIPARVTSFDADTQLASVEISIMMRSYGIDIAHPQIVMVPVHFVGGNKFFIEHQVDPGDEGMIIFSQRCIDAWVDQGGVATQSVERKFDKTDAMFIPGFRSQPNKISGFDNDGIKISSADGATSIWLKGDGTVVIKATQLIVEGDIISGGKPITTWSHPP